MSEKQIAVVVGAGPGLGNALVRRFAEAGMNVAAVSRKGRLPDMTEHRDLVRGYACDATVGDEVITMFARVTAELGPPDLVVYNVGTWDRAGILDISDDCSSRPGVPVASADFLSAGKQSGRCCPANEALSFLVAPPARSVAVPVLPPLPSRSSACAHWPRAWPASLVREVFTSPMLSLTA